MKLLGYDFNVTRTKAVAPNLQPISGRGGWWPMIREAFTGAWQQNVEVRVEDVLTYAAVYSCITLIAGDIGKLRITLVEQDANGIWTEVSSPAFSPVLRKPNRYQTRIAFLENWMTSKLIHGNTYVLKERDNRGVVVALYILDPTRVKVLVAPDGSVFYEIQRDYLAGQTEDVVYAPAKEIIHDVMVPLYHPLCGVSPITACGLAAIQGLRVQNYSAKFFANGSVPSGVLTAPGVINEITAKRLQTQWESQFTGTNAGRTAVLGDGLKYEQMTMSAVDAQLIDQLKWTAETVCQAFHVPAFMIGVGSAPTYNNIEALTQQYYQQTLQKPIETIELLLDEGLGLDQQDGKILGTELDLDDLLRMDTATRTNVAKESLTAGMSHNEVRKRFLNLGPVVGGNSPMSQQQNYSLEALAKRDASADPFATAKPAPSKMGTDDHVDEDDLDKAFTEEFRKALAA
jgi:HK97 family phage portal protein